jgi:hypothetical protein
MKRIRIELAKSRADAVAAAQVLRGLGYTVTEPEPSRTVHVFDASGAPGDAVIVYRDASDGEVWTVIGRVNS